MSNNIRNLVATNFAWKFAEQILAQSINVIVSIVLARILLPEEYGVITIILIIIQICDVFISQGFACALIQKKDVDDRDYSSMFYASFILSLTIYGVLFYIAPYVARSLGSGYESLGSILRVMGLQIPISSFRSIQQAKVARNLIFKKFFFSTLGGKVTSAFVGIAMALNGFGAWALAAQSIVNVLLDTIILYITVRWSPILYFSFNRIRGMISFGSRMVLAGLVDVIYAKLRGMVIAKNYTPSDLAYYEKGDQFPFLIMNNTNSSIMSVIFPILSKCQDDRVLLLAYCRKVVKICTFVIFPLLLWLAFISEDLICLLMSDKWKPSAEYAIIFCAVYSFYPIYTINLQAIKAIGKSGAYLYLEITKKISGIICLVVFIPFGIYWIAMSLLVSTMINYFINGLATHYVLEYRFRNQILDIFPNIFSIAVVLLFLLVIPIDTGNRLINIFVSAFAVFAIYISTAFLLKNESLILLKNIIKQKIKNESNKKLL